MPKPVAHRHGRAALVVAVAAGSAVLVAATPGPAVTAARDATLVLVPGARTAIGDDAGGPDERPSFTAVTPSLYVDRTPVTVRQFAAFVAATGYVDDAKRLGGAAVFDRRRGEWSLVARAGWRRPEGPGAAAAAADHPVTQVSWRDADAFCRNYGARLPTEIEWEAIARRGQTADGHVFGPHDNVKRGGKFAANVWQGLFPVLDSGEDGFRGTSPVGAFGTAPSGLTDMAGNVWEWTASWYRPYAERGQVFRPGAAAERVQRGGSFLCDPNFCRGFRVTARAHSTPETSAMHVGFRCVLDTPAAGTVRAGRLVRVAAKSKGKSDA